mmetsp:Transcript_3925/g.5804  ORF Transcript_3925/g.5804 Transcript_3925/m.5804 type:complete len:89 (+) Transcript_3925:516-782(+)
MSFQDSFGSPTNIAWLQSLLNTLFSPDHNSTSSGKTCMETNRRPCCLDLATVEVRDGSCARMNGDEMAGKVQRSGQFITTRGIVTDFH